MLTSRLTWTLLLLATGLGGCASGPRDWFPEQHQEMLRSCRAACRGKMQSYEPYTGECTCATPILTRRLGE